MTDLKHRLLRQIADDVSAIRAAIDADRQSTARTPGLCPLCSYMKHVNEICTKCGYTDSAGEEHGRS